MSSPSNLLECSVCFDSKEKREFDYLPCFHSFCRSCIERFHVKTCPLCRRPFGINPNETLHSRQAFSAPARLEGSSLVSRTYVAVEHIHETPRARRRRRNPRRRDRRRMRPRDSRRDEIFHLEIDDILPENKEESDQEGENVVRRKRRSRRRRDAYQQLRLQRNLRTSLNVNK